MSNSKIFISYSRLDMQFASKLTKDLKQDEINFWIDNIDIQSGARWEEEIEKALHGADIILVILSPNSVASKNVRDEISYALDAAKRVIPILIVQCEIPLRINALQLIDFKLDYHTGYNNLKSSLDIYSRRTKEKQNDEQKGNTETLKHRNYDEKIKVKTSGKLSVPLIQSMLLAITFFPGVAVLFSDAILPIDDYINKLSFTALNEILSILFFLLIWHNKQVFNSISSSKMNKLLIFSFTISFLGLLSYLLLYNEQVIVVSEYDPVLMPISQNNELKKYISSFGPTPEAVIEKYGRDTLVDAVHSFSRKALFLSCIYFSMLYVLIYLPIVFIANLFVSKRNNH